MSWWKIIGKPPSPTPLPLLGELSRAACPAIFFAAGELVREITGKPVLVSEQMVAKVKARGQLHATNPLTLLAYTCNNKLTGKRKLWGE